MNKLLLKWKKDNVSKIVNVVDPIINSHFDYLKEGLPPSAKISVVDWATNRPMLVCIGDCTEEI